jgi:hypothetical protein
MGILGDRLGRNGRVSTLAPSMSAAPPALSTPPGPAPPAAASVVPHTPEAGSELGRRRDRLAEEVTELHWDLGGLAYEMAIRDHFRLDVLVRRAATLQERDAELAEVERLLRMEADGTAGSCPHCGAAHSRGASFCWRCGSGLIEQRRHGGPPHGAREPEPGSASDG